MPRNTWWLALAVMAVLCGTSAAPAQTLSRLPADLTLAQSGDSPGNVVFSHQAHLAVQARPDCTVCHPKLAPILKQQAARRDPITHARMLKGQACGACHGKNAHGFDDCTTCHKS
jgi:c(7)-type cytochrome triheme protein